MLSISLKILADLVAAAIAGARVSADIRTRSQPIRHVGGGHAVSAAHAYILRERGQCRQPYTNGAESSRGSGVPSRHELAHWLPWGLAQSTT